MRPYRYLLRRIWESVAAIFFFTVFCYAIFSFGWFDFPDPLISSPPPPFTWDHFWLMENAPGSIINFERFSFYFSHVFSGDFGQSWRTSGPVRLELFFASITTLALVLAACLIALGIGVLSMIGRHLNRFEQERRGVPSDSQTAPRNEMLLFFLFLVNALLLCILYFWIIFTFPDENPYYMRPYGYDWGLIQIESFWYPALILSGVLFFGYKILFHQCTLGIVPHTFVQTPESSTGLRDSISLFGARVGLFCGLVVSSIIFIEGGFIPIPSYRWPYIQLRFGPYGFGFQFCRSFWFHFDFPMLNAWMFLVGLALILITLIAEVCYGLWKYGPFESTLSKLRSKYFK